MTEAGTPIGEDDLQAHVDGRLSPDKTAALAGWLSARPEAAAQVAREREQREQLRARLADKAAEPIPIRLRIASIRAGRRARTIHRLRSAAAAILLMLAGAAGGWLARGPAELHGAEPEVAALVRDATLAYRTYTVEVVHAVEVPASNEAHLVAWLSKRLGKPLTVPDLTPYGMKLVGGRLLPYGNGAAAQFMFENAAGKRLTLYICTGANEQTAFRFQDEDGTATFSWMDQGFGFAVSARAGRDELLPIAETVYKVYGG